MKCGFAGSANGRGAAARFSRPRGLALDPDGNLFVVDTANQTIRIGRPDPSLQATGAGGQVVLSWPAWATGYQLQSSGTFGADWSIVSGSPAVVSNRFVVTNLAVQPHLFFRLQPP